MTNFSDQHCLSVQNLGCARGDKQLFSNLSFELTNRTCLHITGANGSGKTSLIRILCTLSNADSGCINWNQQSIFNNEDYLQNIAYVGHKDGLKTTLTATENLHYYQSLDGDIDTEIIDQSLHKMELLDSADRKVANLSFGQKRRLALTRLLLQPRRLWILDEPLTGIDQRGHELVETLCEQQIQNGGSIILTNHHNLADSKIAPFLQQLAL